MRQKKYSQATNTSWQGVAKWYHQSVGADGHYYHQQVVIPNLKKHLKVHPGEKVLDLACGQGVISHYLPKASDYTGVDLSKDLINYAKQQQKQLSPTQTHFIHSDITKKLPLNHDEFDWALVILALQNVKYPDQVFANANRHLKNNGQLLLVLNHPCFRIPRQSGWGIDEKTKLQYRKINRYLTPMDIPIDMNPGRREKHDQQMLTMSYHYPLSYYFEELSKNGFVVEALEEWTSDKKSQGKMKKMEDRARQEFPLFLFIKAKKA